MPTKPVLLHEFINTALALSTNCPPLTYLHDYFGSFCKDDTRNLSPVDLDFLQFHTKETRRLLTKDTMTPIVKTERLLMAAYCQGEIK